MLVHIKDARNHWTVIVNNKAYQFDPSSEFYDKLVECVKTDDAETLVNLIDKERIITEWSFENFKVEDGVLRYNGETIADTLAERILEMIEQGFDYMPMLAFVKNLYANVSMRSVDELYKFLEHKHLPITPDGCFIAYKGVIAHAGSTIKDKMGRDVASGDLVDKYTGKSYRNNVGDVNSTPRRCVNDDANVGCAEGLHVGSLKYATDYAAGSTVVLCKVNPSHVVSVPHDCECQKVRVSEYEVIGICEKALEDAVYSQENDEYHNDEDEDYDDEELEDPYEGDGWNG